MSKQEIEDHLKEFLGLEKVIWLWKGMAGDDAVVNGHVDNLACFVRPGVVALSWCDDINDPQVQTPRSPSFRHFTFVLCCLLGKGKSQDCKYALLGQKIAMCVAQANTS